MGTPAANRKLGHLYAGLTPAERARLLARLWREHDAAELDRLRQTIPDAAAGAAYNRAVALLRNLNGATFLAALAAMRNGFELDIFTLMHLYERVADRRNDRANLHRVWGLLGYPVTRTEYRTFVELERSEPYPLDAYAEILADFDGTEPGLHPDVAALLRGLPPDLVRDRLPNDHKLGDPIPPDELAEDTRQAAEITARVRHVNDAAVRRGELPKPRRRKGEPCLPVGTLSDWGEGTTPETFEPFGPSYRVPMLELVGGGSAEWDTRPDEEADAVRARRRKLLDVLGGIVRDAGHVTEDDLDRLTLDPPLSGAARERSLAERDRIWPWATVERDEFRAWAARFGARRAELRAYTDALEMFQAEDFGGEDPLAPEARPFLERARDSARDAETIWDRVAEQLKPIGDDEPWPPSLDNDAYYAETRQCFERSSRSEDDE